MGFKVAILTISDTASKGARKDLSGPFIREFLESIGPFKVKEMAICPDEIPEIKRHFIDWCDKKAIDLVVTTGGTGLSPRDVTPEATIEVIERECPGMALAMLLYGMKKTPRAMLSRGRVGVRKETLIVNLPGSKKAVEDGLNALKDILEHALLKIKGDTTPCGT